ncbi:MAG: hypothetical protein ACK56A_01160 [Bacteroidota bacterium]
MKINSCFSFYLLMLPCLLLSMAVRSQSTPSTNNSLPAFHLQLIDSSFYVSNQPNARKFIAIIYFSPDCGHCIEMTEALVQKADSLSSTLVLMAANKPLQELQQFSDQFRLRQFPGILLGQDISYAIVPFYRIEYTPFVALYGPKRELVRTWRSPEQPFRLDEFLTILHTK